MWDDCVAKPRFWGFMVLSIAMQGREKKKMKMFDEERGNMQAMKKREMFSNQYMNVFSLYKDYHSTRFPIQICRKQSIVSARSEQMYHRRGRNNNDNGFCKLYIDRQLKMIGDVEKQSSPMHICDYVKSGTFLT